MIEPKAHGYRIIVERKPVKMPGSNLILEAVLGNDDKPSPLHECTVISVGDDKVLLDGIRLPIKVKVGDRVAFTQALQKIQPSWMFGNRDMFVVNVEDITLVLEGQYELAPPKIEIPPPEISRKMKIG